MPRRKTRRRESPRTATDQMTAANRWYELVAAQGLCALEKRRRIAWPEVRRLPEQPLREEWDRLVNDNLLFSSLSRACFGLFGLPIGNRSGSRRIFGSLLRLSSPGWRRWA